ncbi:hypothetical protein UY3_03629 [Chelonia mydas]|uniref:Uncharacterized protein n=1 Tax=Chelonia mydas TaxID=8469 RepID=M7BPE2_CHEMY|nr:hypothetical protein UY3_03629 [Chelonia mydas]
MGYLEDPINIIKCKVMDVGRKLFCCSDMLLNLELDVDKQEKVQGGNPGPTKSMAKLGGTLLMAAEPTEVTASASQPGPESPGAPLVGAGQPTSFLERGLTKDHPPPDAMAVTPTIEPTPGITAGHLPTPQTLEPDQEGPPPGSPATGAQDLASAPLPKPVPDPCPAPVADPVPIPSTSRDVITAPGAVSFPFPEDDPQGAAFMFPCPKPLGAAIFPPPAHIEPGSEAGHVVPTYRTPCRGSAPCLPISVGHRAVPGAPPEEGQGPVTPAPHTLREELQEFLEDVRGSHNKMQLTLQQWGHFHQILRATRALMGEGKRTRKQAAAAYQRVLSLLDTLTYGVQLQLPLAARDGEALEGSFLVLYQGAHYRGRPALFYGEGLVLPLPGDGTCPEGLPLGPARRSVRES